MKLNLIYLIILMNIENESSNLLSASTRMESKKFAIEDINKFEQKNLCIEEKLANLLLKKSEVILNTKNEGEKRFFIFESVNYGDYHIFINYDKLLQIKEYFITHKIESIIAKSYFKYMEFLDEFKDRIYKEFTNEYKLKIGLEFQIMDKSKKDSIFNINCYYKFYSPDLNIPYNQIFKEENVLLNKTNSKTQGFEYLIYEINEEYFKENKFQDSSQKEGIKESDNIFNNEPNNEDSFNDYSIASYINDSVENHSDLKMEAPNYQILKIIDILGEHKNTAEFIIELSNGYYISGGTDNILKIYDREFNQIEELKDIPEWTYSCFEIEKLFNQKERDDKIELIACCNKILYQITLSFKDEIKHRYQRYELPHIEVKNCIQMSRNNFAIIGQNNSIFFIDLFYSNNKHVPNSSIVSGKSYIGSIKINPAIIAITSNKVQYYGEDKLIFYNTDKNKISLEIEGYSFISGINGLALMPREETKAKNKILLCACTKYLDSQKNGIYLANPQLEDNKGINNPFYDTGNFEVFCFCPILVFDLEVKIIYKGMKKEIIDTEYFLVGGFNVDKKEGEIKLFRVIYNEKAYNNKIEFVQNIEFERNKDFTGFEGAVSCITQIKENIDYSGFILVTCYSGKIYLLTKPNLDFYERKRYK